MTTTKVCAACLSEKILSEFSPDRRKSDGVVSKCKKCLAEYVSKRRAENHDHYLKTVALWRYRNRELLAARKRLRRLADPEKARRQSREYSARNRKKETARITKRRREDPVWRLRSLVSNQIRYCLRTNKGGQTAESLLGYRMAELRRHLERQFLKGMSWENMGEWHIDHIVPLAAFDISDPNDPEIRRAWALTNLRPIWAKDNLQKSSKRRFLL